MLKQRWMADESEPGVRHSSTLGLQTEIEASGRRSRRVGGEGGGEHGAEEPLVFVLEEE